MPTIFLCSFIFEIYLLQFYKWFFKQKPFYVCFCRLISSAIFACVCVLFSSCSHSTITHMDFQILAKEFLLVFYFIVVLWVDISICEHECTFPVRGQPFSMGSWFIDTKTNWGQNKMKFKRMLLCHQEYSQRTIVGKPQMIWPNCTQKRLAEWVK